jgi:hypothetical protein
MWDLQLSRTQYTIIVEKNVQVQDPGTEPGAFRPTSHGMFDGLQPCEKGFWFKISTNPNDTIYKPVLRFQVNWFSLIKGRLGLNFATFALTDCCNPLATIVGLIPNVRSYAYVGCMLTLTLHKQHAREYEIKNPGPKDLALV